LLILGLVQAIRAPSAPPSVVGVYQAGGQVPARLTLHADGTYVYQLLPGCKGIIGTTCQHEQPSSGTYTSNGQVVTLRSQGKVMGLFAIKSNELLFDGITPFVKQ